MKNLEKEYDSLKKDDIRDKATTDPMFKYYKRFLPKPRYEARKETLTMNNKS